MPKASEPNIPDNLLDDVMDGIGADVKTPSVTPPPSISVPEAVPAPVSSDAADYLGLPVSRPVVGGYKTEQSVVGVQEEDHLGIPVQQVVGDHREHSLGEPKEEEGYGRPVGQIEGKRYA